MDPVSKAQTSETSQGKRLLRGGHSPYIGKRWPKGVSGNPGGRRKKPAVTKMFENIFDDKRLFNEIQDSMALTLKSGRMSAVLLLREAAERLEGKVTQPVEVDAHINVSLAAMIQERRKKRGKHASNDDSE